MAELDAEKVDLRRADEHIARARQLLDQQREIFERTKELEVGAEEAGNLLQAMEQSLVELEKHRLQIIDRMRALGG